MSKYPNEQSSMFSAYDFSNTVDPNRYTRAVYAAPTAALTASCTNETGTPAAHNMPIGGTYLMIRTKTACTGTGLTFVYLYDKIDD